MDSLCTAILSFPARLLSADHNPFSFFFLILRNPVQCRRHRLCKSQYFLVNNMYVSKLFFCLTCFFIPFTRTMSFICTHLYYQTDRIVPDLVTRVTNVLDLRYSHTTVNLVVFKNKHYCNLIFNFTVIKTSGFYYLIKSEFWV